MNLVAIACNACKGVSRVLSVGTAEEEDEDEGEAACGGVIGAEPFPSVKVSSKLGACKT